MESSLQRVASHASLTQELPCTTQSLAQPQQQQHHYHYIQYPAHYQQASQQPTTNANVNVLPQQCQCPCSCGRASGGMQQQQQQQTNMAVAVIVHQQSPEQQQPVPIKAQSAQSLLNHSYQALQLQQEEQEQKRLNTSVGAISCDCDLECTCGAMAINSSNSSSAAAQHKRSLLADAMLGADEITVSESDNNSTMLKKKKPRVGELPAKAQPASSCNDIYHDTELEIASTAAAAAAASNVGCCRKSQSLEDNRPPLPPRPPPRPRSAVNSSLGHRHGAGIKKYVVWCLICGGFSCLLGVLFLGVYFLLHSYTITVGNFETVPTFVPATLLILTGVCIMSLARRRNRYSYLIKLSGACGLVSALTCALVTVTTTVLHMSRLQALRECEYAQKTRTCTCYSDLIESQVDRVDKEGVRLVFDSLSDCGVVHGSLYSCLRAIFGLSVAGVLIAVFSCMLVYQLLSHERKKMYWEQLELRCRSLYASQAPPPSLGAMSAPGRMLNLNCRCCEQCHAHRQLTLPLQATAYPWDEAAAAAAAAAAAGGAEQRFWATQPPGNFYSPNPGSDDAATAAACRVGERAARSSSGWSWPRMPWQRQTPDTARRFRQAAASPDSQYGFSSAAAAADGNQMLIEEQLTPGVAAAYNGMPPPNALPYGVWGPPPPYSDPNSPARRGYYQYLQPTACLGNGQLPIGERNPLVATTLVHAHSSSLLEQSHLHQQQQLQQQQQQRLCGQHQGAATLERMDGLANSVGNVAATSVGRAAIAAYKAKAAAEYENTHSDSDGCGARERCSNTLPTRKLKKRIEAGAKSIGPTNNNNNSQHRPNVQQVFACETIMPQLSVGVVDVTPKQQAAPQPSVCNGGVENNGYQDSNGAIANGSGLGSRSNNNNTPECLDAAESEVYFADVSSCCNMSVKNDNYYEDAQQRAHRTAHHHALHHQHSHQHSNCSHSSNQSGSNSTNATSNNNNSSNSNAVNEDYLAQRFGRREHSIRSRLPFPQSRCEDDYESSNLNMPTLKSAALEQQQQQLQKDISRQSMCSVESEAKTEFTDLSPSTPCGDSLPPPPASFASDPPAPSTPKQSQHAQQSPNFVASFPYSSESQCLEAHRRSTKNIHEMLLAGGESHYEVINDRGGNSCNYQLQRSSGGGSKHKSKSKTRSREQLDIYGSGGGAGASGATERPEWSDSGVRSSSKRL